MVKPIRNTAICLRQGARYASGKGHDMPPARGAIAPLNRNQPLPTIKGDN